MRSQTETPKRYRYTGKERDEESGLYYHGARYYAPWLGRWVSCDPAGLRGGINLFLYADNSPVLFMDTTGMQPSNCFIEFPGGQKLYSPKRCGSIDRWRSSEGTGGEAGRSGKRRGVPGGIEGGVPEGTEGGVPGGIGGSTGRHRGRSTGRYRGGSTGKDTGGVPEDGTETGNAPEKLDWRRNYYRNWYENNTPRQRGIGFR